MTQAVQTPFTVAQTTVPIAGSALRFPVRRIYCIGRNYAAHAIEMGSDPSREPPFFFQKPTDAIQGVLPDTVRVVVRATEVDGTVLKTSCIWSVASLKTQLRVTEKSASRRIRS